MDKIKTPEEIARATLLNSGIFNLSQHFDMAYKAKEFDDVLKGLATLFVETISAERNANLEKIVRQQEEIDGLQKTLFELRVYVKESEERRQKNSDSCYKFVERIESLESKLAESEKKMETWNMDRQHWVAKHKELEAEAKAVRSALEKIRDYQPIEPPYPTEKMKSHGDGSDCKACAEYKNHPISHGICDAGHRIIYGWENACKYARNYRWIEMSNIAKEAIRALNSGEGE